MSRDTSARLDIIATWLQQSDEAILYRPDGLAAGAESQAVAPLHLSQWLSADACALSEATRVVQALGTTAEAAGRSFQALGAAFRMAGHAGEALREALPTPGDTPEDAPEEHVGDAWRPMSRDVPRYESWAAGATPAQLAACEAAGVPYAALVVLRRACGPRETVEAALCGR